MKNNNWYKLLYREDVDLLTISTVDLGFFNEIKKFIHSDKERFFSYFSDDRIFTHYTNLDTQKFGMYIFQKYFNSLAKSFKKNININ